MHARGAAARGGGNNTARRAGQRRPLAQVALPYVNYMQLGRIIRAGPAKARSARTNLRKNLDNLVQCVFNNALSARHAQTGDKVAHHVDLHH